MRRATLGIVRNMRSTRLILLVIAGMTACAPGDAPVALNACVDCHEDRASGFSAAHAFAAEACVACHGGDAASADEATAHAGLIAFPGNMDNVERACASCHAGASATACS